VVNTGADAVTLDVGEREVLFATPSGVALDAGSLAVPGHAGSLLGPPTTFR